MFTGILSVIGVLSLLVISFVCGGVFATRKIRRTASDIEKDINDFISHCE